MAWFFSSKFPKGSLYLLCNVWWIWIVDLEGASGFDENIKNQQNMEVTRNAMIHVYLVVFSLLNG